MDCNEKMNDPYSMMKCLITMAVFDAERNGNNKALVYVKGCEWLVLDTGTFFLNSNSNRNPWCHS